MVVWLKERRRENRKNKNEMRVFLGSMADQRGQWGRNGRFGDKGSEYWIMRE